MNEKDFERYIISLNKAIDKALKEQKCYEKNINKNNTLILKYCVN